MSLSKVFTGPRIFKRLDIVYDSLTPHRFFLDQMVYYQWNNKPPFVSGPAIEVEEAKDKFDYWSTAGKIEYSLRYFMKPYTIRVFGYNVENTEYSHLLTRLYLHSNTSSNNACVLMERIPHVDNENTMNYMTAINNRLWQPLHWEEVEKASAFEQTLVESPNWEVKMRYI